MFTDGYLALTGPLGYVYYKPEGVCIDGDISINYMEYPWITCFEVEGIVIEKQKVRSLQKLKISHLFLFLILHFELPNAFLCILHVHCGHILQLMDE